jgi:hypothetical protein
MISVYIASAYSLPLGHQEKNTIKSFKVFNELRDCGFMPFAPLTSHYINLNYKRSYNDWIEYDLFWLAKCDCVLRLPSKSKGADIEVKEAKKLKKPVFYSISELKSYYREHHKKTCDNCTHNLHNYCELWRVEILNIYKNTCGDHKLNRSK